MEDQNTLQVTPRRRDAAATRAKILTAAQRAFAEMGYTQAGIRLIASRAGVDSALVQRYFGSKAGLFEAALTEAIAHFHKLEADHVELGPRLASEFLADLFDLRAQSMIALSTSDGEARDIVAKVLKRCAIDPLAAMIGPPHADARAVRLLMLATGFTLFTRQIPLLSPDEAVTSGTSQWLSELLQNIFTGEMRTN